MKRYISALVYSYVIAIAIVEPLDSNDTTCDKIMCMYACIKVSCSNIYVYTYKMFSIQLHACI